MRVSSALQPLENTQWSTESNMNVGYTSRAQCYVHYRTRISWFQLSDIKLTQVASISNTWPLLFFKLWSSNFSQLKRSVTHLSAQTEAVCSRCYVLHSILQLGEGSGFIVHANLKCQAHHTKCSPDMTSAYLYLAHIRFNDRHVLNITSNNTSQVDM